MAKFATFPPEGLAPLPPSIPGPRRSLPVWRSGRSPSACWSSHCPRRISRSPPILRTMKAIPWLLAFLLLCLGGDSPWRQRPAWGHSRSAPQKRALFRSPTDLAILPGGERVLTANQSANSVSLVDLKHGKVLAEMDCGVRPVAVACTRDAKRGAVSNLWSGTITLFEIHSENLKPTRVIQAGAFPRELIFAPHGKT